VNREHLVSQAAYAGLVALVFVFVTLAITAAFVTKSAARDAAAAVQRSDLFSSVRFEVGAEQSLHRKYQLEPSSETLRGHADAAQRLVKKLRAVTAAASDVSSMNVADALLLAHGRYLTATHLLFAAVDAHDAVRARAIDHLIVDRAFGTFQATVEEQARKSMQLADVALEKLRHTENLVITLTIVASFAAVVVLGVILTVLRHYKQQVDATIANEMDSLKRAALTDYLTGLANHRAYQEDLQHIAAAWRSDGAGLIVALIDVDEFKALNDRQGHVTGDNLLSSLANVLRVGDVQSIPYRLGGDEFAVTFPGVSLEAARERMEHVRSVVEAELGGTTVSIGLATSIDAGSDLLLLREQADTALYEAKRRGRNRVVAFDDIRDEAAMFMPARVAEVRDLIADGIMGVAFQPIWDIKAGRVIGYEGLARPPGANPINPQDAFDIAERIGKAHDLDRICRVAVLEQARSLPHDALLFVNVSPQSLDHEEFAGTALVRAIAAIGLTPDRVVLEITERSIARLPVVVREARRLRALGFALALDDAGSGNSGLEMLSQLAVDFVKIDREVIVQAQTGSGGRAVLAGIVAIAQEMRAQIIAEGIEDSTMLNLVRNATRWSSIPCAVQGYYLGRPAPGFVDAATLAVVEHRLTAPYDLETPNVAHNLEIPVLT
jgi:diguanylate cyclase (GGDEF)-like protein